MQLQDRVAIIIGAAQGLGAATAAREHRYDAQKLDP